MNIARTLAKPAVSRGKKNRRRRRIRRAFNVAVLILLLSSAAFAAYWTVIGIGIVWRTLGSPALATTWAWLQGMTSAERFMWLNYVGWGAAGIGLLSSFWLYAHGTRWVKWLMLISFTYCYGFMWYIVWLAIESFIGMNGWTANGLLGFAVISYVWIVSHTGMSKSSPKPKQEIEGESSGK